MLQLINQPFDGQLGNILIDKLSEDKYKAFVIVSAFAKNSGVLRLKDSIQEFHDKGGKIQAFIGIDAHGTSYEALLNLFYLVDDLYIIHDSNSGTTFHSKIYYLSDLNELDWIAVGSNNLTGGGLWTNIESSTIFDTELSTNSKSISYFKPFIKFIAELKSNSCPFSM